MLSPLGHFCRLLGCAARSLRAVSLLATAALAVSARAITADTLRVEYADHPLGLDVAQPRLSWVLHADERAQRQTAYQVLVATSRENAMAEKGDVWDSGKIASSENVGIEYAGPALRGNARYFWRVRVWDADEKRSAWSEPSWWQMGLLTPEDWKAKWIGGAESGSPRLRSEFRLAKKVLRATAHAYAVGWYRLWMNGTEITERVLAPVNSNYPKGLFYDSYDITPLLHEGENAIGLWLGNGYGQTYSQWGYRWNQPLAALAQLAIVYADGTTETVITDGHWKWSESPVVANDIYHGETFDARREQVGWSTAGFDDHDWKPVVLRDAPAGPLRSCPFPGLAIAADLHPVKLSEPKPGVFIFDLGQNIAGWVRLQVKGPAGSRIVLRHAEDLTADGTLDATTNRAALATDTYILRGHGTEAYEPRFTYHGFRYVEMTGYPGTPTLESITGRAMHAALEEAGSFECSDPLVNRMHRNFRWTIANNLVGIPTDTPARDERTPCQMDSLAVEDAAICNFAMNPYYTKWLHDIAGDGGTLPSWTGDQVVLPFLLYMNYGDRRILEQHYDNMKHVVDTFAASEEKSQRWAEGFGDWAAPSPNGDYKASFSEGELVATAFFFRSARIVADVAQLLGRRDDERQYADLAERIRTAFISRLYHAESATYSSGRQITSVLPLAFGLVRETDTAAVFTTLCRRIETTDKGHVDTGIFGTRYLFETLIDHGQPDLAFKVLTASGYPGYVDQISQGATTTWEQWALHGKMQTHDHAMFAGPDATLFSRFGGIQAAAPGFREIIIRPAIPDGLSYVDCARQTVMGKVACSWRKTASELTLRVSVPVNTVAQVHIPATALDRVREGTLPAAKASGVLSAQMAGRFAVLKLGSGDYVFAVR